MRIVFCPLPLTPELRSKSSRPPYLRRMLFAYLHLRSPFAQHTREENAHPALVGRGKRSSVEIGVAECASAIAYAR